MNAIPPGFTSPFTIGVTKPVAGHSTASSIGDAAQIIALAAAPVCLGTIFTFSMLLAAPHVSDQGSRPCLRK